MKTPPWLLFPLALFFMLLALLSVRELPEKTEEKREPVTAGFDPAEPILPVEKWPVKPGRPMVTAPAPASPR
jgi:hypothetical protein